MASLGLVLRLAGWREGRCSLGWGNLVGLAGLGIEAGTGARDAGSQAGAWD